MSDETELMYETQWHKLGIPIKTLNKTGNEYDI